MKSLSLPLLIAVLISSYHPSAVALEAGFGAVDITPYPLTSSDPSRSGYDSPYGRIYLGGFGPKYPVPRWIVEPRWAQGVHDPIWARAVAVREGDQTIVMISTDLSGLVWKYINPARREIAKRFNVPFENIIIASTHDHSSPDAAGYWSTFIPGHGDKYNHQLVKWMIEAGSKALMTLQPAQVKSLTATHYSCINPKTKEMKKEPNCNLPKNRADYELPGGDQYDQMIIQTDKRDPIVRNTDITIQHFVKPDTRETLGTFINWSNHPDTMGSDNRFVSSDFPHYVRDMVEHNIGGTAVYFSGTVGAQIGPGVPNPLWDKNRQPVYTGEVTPSGQRVRAMAPNGDSWDSIRSIGYEIGNEVVQAIRNDSGPYASTAPISIKSRKIDVAPTNLVHVLATGSVWRSDIQDAEDEMYWYPGRCMGKYGCVRSDVVVAQIGDMALVTGPGEIDPVYVFGRPESKTEWHKGKKTWKETFPGYPGFKSLIKAPHLAVLGQAQNYLSYEFPQSDNIGPLNFKHPNHYEEMVTVSKYFGDDVGNLWMEMLGSNYRYNKRTIMPKVKSEKGLSNE